MKKSNKLTAAMTASAVMAAMVVPAASAASASFNDIDSSFAKDAIVKLADLGILNGKGEGKFDPAGNVTRAEFAKILTLALKLDVSSAPASATFADVATDAWSYKYVEAASKAKLINGVGNGQFGPNAMLSREDMAVLFVRALGADKAAGKGASLTFADKDSISDYAKDAVAYAVELGLINGKSDNKFDAKGNASREAIAKVANLFLDKIAAADLKIAGKTNVAVGEKVQFTVAGAKSVKWSVSGNGVIDQDGNFVGNAAGDATVTAVADGQTLKQAVTVVNNQLAVTSVTAINLKQVKVAFNAPVDKTTAETVTNYSFSASNVAAFNPESATLQADGKTVLLVLVDANVPANQATRDLKVTKVADANGVAITDTTQTVTFQDLVIPTVSNVTVVGPKTIKVWFSEPVKSAQVSDFVLDGGTYSVGLGTNNNIENSLTLTAGTNLPAGAHTLVVNSASGNTPATADYAGFKVPTATLNFNVVVDTVAPKIDSVVKASQTSVTVKFSKPVATTSVTTGSFYHTFSGYAPDAVTPVNGGAYDDTYKLTFTSRPLPASAVTLYVLRGATGAEIVDAWGNILADKTETVTANVVADVTKPSIKSVVAKDDKTLVVTYSKDVNVADAQNATNYTLQDSTGVALSASGIDAAGHPDVTTGIVYDSTKQTATLSFANSIVGGSYKLVVKGVKDNALVANTMDDATAPFSVTDTTAPIVGTAYLQTSSNKITVNFSEPMATSGAGSIADLANYQLNNKALPDGTTITVGSNSKSVIIAVPTTTTVNLSDSFSVGQVSDLAGNKVAGFGKSQTLTGAVAPTAARAKATGTKTVTFEVNQPLAGITTTGLTVAGNPVAGASFVNQKVGANSDIDGALVTLTFATAVDKATPGDLVIASATGSKNALGTAIADGTISISDKVAPYVDTTLANGGYTYVSSTEIDFSLSEPLDPASLAATGLNGFSVSGGTVTGANLKAADATNKTIKITGTGFTSNMTVSYNGTNGVADANANALAAFSAQSLTDKIAPAIVTVANYGFNNGTGKVVATAADTFAEPVQFQAYIGSTAPTATTAPTASTSVYLTSLTANQVVLNGLAGQTAGTKVYYRTVDQAGNASAWTQDGVVAGNVAVAEISKGTDKVTIASAVPADTDVITVSSPDLAAPVTHTVTATEATNHTFDVAGTGLTASSSVTVTLTTADGNVSAVVTK